MQGAVGVAVAAAVESVAHGFAAGCFERADPAEFGERGVAADPVGVVAKGGQQSGGGVGADAVDGAQWGAAMAVMASMWCSSGLVSASRCRQRAASDLIAMVTASVGV